MADEVEQIKEKIDLVEVISQYVKLKKVGRSLVGLCPFHHEKTPSFNVSPERQFYHCFGCSKSGDVFSFLMEKEGLEFGEALRILAQKAGVELKSRNFDPQKQQKKERLQQAVSLTSRLYQHVLEKMDFAQKAQDYLAKRGIKEEMTDFFELGYAPKSFETTGNFLQKKGFSLGELLEAGLVIGISSARGRLAGSRSDAAPPNVSSSSLRAYDRFRGRLTFPIKDLFGRTVGFSARALDNEEPKYLNSPDSLVFQKGLLLYRLDLAKEEIRKKDQVVLVEGNLDVISAFQAGFRNVIAPLGSALTEDHLKMIKRFTHNLIFAFDTDEGGQKATLRALPIAQSLGLNSRVAVWKEAKDPDELIQKNPACFEQAINKAGSAFDFLFDCAKSRFDLETANGKNEIAGLLIPFLIATNDPIVLDALAKNLASRLGIEEKSLWQEIEKIKDQRSKIKNYENEDSEGNKALAVKTKTRQELLGERLLVLMLAWPKEEIGNIDLRELIGSITPTMLEVDWQAELFEILASRLLAGLSLEEKEVVEHLSITLKDLFDQLLLQASKEEENSQSLLSELSTIVLEIKKAYRVKELTHWKNQLAQAEKNGDQKTVAELKSRIKELLNP